MKKDFKKIELSKKLRQRRYLSEASSKAFTEICQKLTSNRKRNVVNTLFCNLSACPLRSFNKTLQEQIAIPE